MCSSICSCCVSVCASIRQRACVGLRKLSEHTSVWVCVSAFACVYACTRVLLVCRSEWALSGAAQCSASCIYSHLCWGSVGGEGMTLMYLNPRQTFHRQSSVWNQDNWAQSSWTSWSGRWAGDRRFGYTITPGQTHKGAHGSRIQTNTRICLGNTTVQRMLIIFSSTVRFCLFCFNIASVCHL